jgi:hypothetical protein
MLQNTGWESWHFLLCYTYIAISTLQIVSTLGVGWWVHSMVDLRSTITIGDNPSHQYEEATLCQTDWDGRIGQRRFRGPFLSTVSAATFRDCLRERKQTKNFWINSDFFSLNTHEGSAFQDLTLALQCIKTLVGTWRILHCCKLPYNSLLGS